MEFDVHWLRAVVVLRVIVRFVLERGEAPSQVQLLPKDSESLFELEWRELKLDYEFPYSVKHPPQLQQAVDLLRDCGLMVAPKYRRKRTRTPNQPTERGIQFAQGLSDDWREWPCRADVCPSKEG